MESATSSTPPSNALSGLERYSILNTKCIGVIDPEGPEKNITTLEMKPEYHR